MSDNRMIRWLGAAFLLVFATSLAFGLLAAQMLDGDVSSVLDRVAGNAAQLRAGNVFQLLTAIGIVPLAALLYVALRDESRPLALIGFGLWLAEAVMCAVSTLGVAGLLTLGTATAGADASADRVMLGRLFVGIEQDAFTALMLFFCAGGLAFYALFFRSRLVPKWMAAWGLAGVTMLLAATLTTAWDRSIDLGLFGAATLVVYVPFEPVIGTWLLVRGASSHVATMPQPMESLA